MRTLHDDGHQATQKHFPGADEIIKGDYFKVATATLAPSMILKKKRLHRDHLGRRSLPRLALRALQHAHAPRLDSLSSDGQGVRAQLT